MIAAIVKTAGSIRGYAVLAGVVALFAGWEFRKSLSSDKPASPRHVAEIPSPSHDLETIEFEWPVASDQADTILLIGSVGDAGTNSTVVIESLPARDAAEQSPVRAVRLDRESFASPLLPHRQVFSDRSAALVVRKPGKPAGLLTRADQSRRRTFFIQTGRNPSLETSYQPITAILAAESGQVLLWCDTESACEIPADDLFWLAECLEQEVLPRITDLFGTIADLDGDGKLSICLTPRLGDLPATESAIEGMVQVNDFLPDLPRPFSNHADLIFLSASLQPGTHLKTILAHEAGHLAVFSRRFEADPVGRRFEDDWLNEGLAHMAERACGGDWSNLDYRIAAFAANSASSPLIVSDAGRQGLWRHPGSRGAAWLFLAWLADEYGPDVIRQLAMHPDVGCEKLEHLVGQPFSDVFRRWSVAVWRSQQLPDRPGDAIRLVSLQHGPVQSDTNLETRLAQGLRRADRLAVINLPAKGRKEMALRGTSFQACRWTSPSEKPVRLRISGPKACRLQVTVLEGAGDQVRMTKVQ